MPVAEQMLYGIRPPQAPDPWWPPYVQYSGGQRALSPPECKAIIEHMGQTDLKQGRIGTTKESARLDLEYRSVYTDRVPVNGFEWLYERLIQRVAWVNNGQYRFDIAGLAEDIQYLEYREAEEGDDESKSGRYNWHTDTGPGIASTRKLSAVIQLSDPSDYDGCRLNLFDCSTPVLEVPETGQGDMVIFPSFTPHCVTPLEKGVRRALALWVTGPTFR